MKTISLHGVLSKKKSNKDSRLQVGQNVATNFLKTHTFVFLFRFSIRNSGIFVLGVGFFSSDKL